MEYLTYTLSDVVISSYQTASAAGQDAPSDSLTLNFKTIQESYAPVNNDFTLGTPVVSSWNQAMHQATGTGTLAAPDATGFTNLGVVFDGGTLAKDEIPASSYTWSEVNGSTFATSQSPVLANFQLSLRPGSAEPTLMADAAAGMSFPQVVIHVRQSGISSLQEYLTYTLSDVHISSYQTSLTAAGHHAPSDSIMLRFEKIDVIYTPYDTLGHPGPQVETSWNQVTKSGTGSTAISQAPSRSPSTGTTISFDGSSEIPASLKWNGSNSTTFASAGSASAADFQLTLPPGAADPTLLLDAAAGKMFDHVLIRVRETNAPGGVPVQYLTYTLGSVHINSYQTGSGSDDLLSLNFRAIKESYAPINTNGSLGPPVTTVWDQRTTSVDRLGPITGTSSHYPRGVTFDGGTTEIAVGSFNWGESNSTSFSAAGGALLQNFQLTLNPGTADPELLANLAAGKDFPQIVLHVRKPVHVLTDYLVYKFDNVHISSYQTTIANGSASPSITLTLNFGTIQESCSPVNKDGSLGTPVVTSWNQATGSPT